MNATETIKTHLHNLVLPEQAVEWLIMLWDLIQTFDDLVDGDAVNRERLDSMIWNALVGFHSNKFFSENSQLLLPCLALSIMKWQASDTVERNGKADAKSYVWRAGFFDVVLMVFQICHGPATANNCAHEILSLYGESLEDYLKEFPNV